MLAYIFALKGNTVSTKTIHSAIGFLWLINSILEEGSIDKKGSNFVTLTLQNVESSLTVKCTVYSAHYKGPTIICHQCSSMSNFIVDVFKTWGFTLLRTIMNTNLKPSVFVTTTAITVCTICTLYGAIRK